MMNDSDINGAAQSSLWPDLYFEDDSGIRDSLRERWRALNDFADEHGGLCPQMAVKDLLGISQGRVSQLVTAGQLHQVRFLGVCWITGNSITAWLAADKSKGGRGRRNPRLWDELVVGGKVLAAISVAAIPDSWVK